MKITVKYPIGYKPNAQLEAKIKHNLIAGYVLYYGVMSVLVGLLIAGAFLTTVEVIYG